MKKNITDEVYSWVLLINNYWVFVLSRIIKVETGVISRSRRMSQLITLTKTVIVLDITKTKYNNSFRIRERKKTDQKSVEMIIYF